MEDPYYFLCKLVEADCWFAGGILLDSIFRPLPNSSGEYEVEDILDVHV